MNSDSKENDVDLAEDLVNLDLDSDWVEEDEDVQNSGDNNSESEQKEIDKSPPAKRDENSNMSLSNKNA